MLLADNGSDRSPLMDSIDSGRIEAIHVHTTRNQRRPPRTLLWHPTPFNNYNNLERLRTVFTQAVLGSDW